MVLTYDLPKSDLIRFEQDVSHTKNFLGSQIIQAYDSNKHCSRWVPGFLKTKSHITPAFPSPRKTNNWILAHTRVKFGVKS